jgi:hypothetical protein
LDFDCESIFIASNLSRKFWLCFTSRCTCFYTAFSRW